MKEWLTHQDDELERRRSNYSAVLGIAKSCLPLKEISIFADTASLGWTVFAGDRAGETPALQLAEREREILFRLHNSIRLSPKALWGDDPSRSISGDGEESYRLIPIVAIRDVVGILSILEGRGASRKGEQDVSLLAEIIGDFIRNRISHRSAMCSYVTWVFSDRLAFEPIRPRWLDWGSFAVAFSALLGLIAFAPLIALISLIIRLDSPGPAVFRQRRIGLGSREFVIYKFRTMRNGIPQVASDLIRANDLPITAIGRVLRRTSLDELPQLVNLLRGEMTLIGPRPALYNQYALIALRKSRGIDQLKPGLTGWAQINGRDDIPLDKKMRLDYYYVRRRSVKLDLKILWRTVFEVTSPSQGAF